MKNSPIRSFLCVSSHFAMICCVFVFSTFSAQAAQPPVFSGSTELVWGNTAPDDYVNPYQRILSQGSVIAEVDVHIEKKRRAVYPFEWFYQLRNVLSFDAPPWAREFMVVFEPSEEMNIGPHPGLYLRPGRPFVETETPFKGYGSPLDGLPDGWMGAMERHAHPQSAYRSETFALNFMEPQHPLFIFVDEHMDPPVSGQSWHVAIGHRSIAPHNNFGDFLRFDDIIGRVRVYARAASEPVPLAFQFFFTREEIDDRTGFFDDTPRTPTGNNPGTTLGEARRWVLYGAAEELLDELDFRGHLPVPVRAVFQRQSEWPRVASGPSSTRRLYGSRHLPGRLANEGIVMSAGRIDRADLLAVVLNRESGTSPSMLSSGAREWMVDQWPVQNVRLAPDNQFPPKTLDGPASVTVFDDTSSGASFSWNLDRPGSSSSAGPGRSLWLETKQALAHSIGHRRAGPMHNLSYAMSFEPPRHFNDNPDVFSDPDGWFQNPEQFQFYGPHAVNSAFNPWRDTDAPGVRMRLIGTSLDAGNGLCDDDGCWSDVPNRGGLFGNPILAFNSPPGIARDMLADMGLADDFRAFRDRRLPRHWFDPTRSGHGIDFRRVEFADGGMAHFAHFYTYDQDGNPEWFMAIGEMEGDTFSAALEYYTFDENRDPPQQASPARQGMLTMDFDPPLDHPTCKDARNVGDAFSSEGVIFAVVDWELDGETGSWCMQPLRFGDTPGMPEDVTGSWLASDSSDVGWGFSLLHRNYGPRPIINAVLYYYDAQGNPVWSSGVIGGGYDLPFRSVMDGIEMEMLHIDGFCRTCEPTTLGLNTAGHMRIRLDRPTFGDDSGNWIESLDVENLGPAGGRWQRSNIGVSLLSSPNPSMDP